MDRPAPSTASLLVVRVVVVATLLIALTACDNFPGVEQVSLDINAQNQTSMALTFQMVVGNKSYPLMGPIPPSANYPIVSFTGAVSPTSLTVGQDGCALGVVIAYDADGREVARHPGPLCVGETWVITAPADAS